MQIEMLDYLTSVPRTSLLPQTIWRRASCKAKMLCLHEGIAHDTCEIPVRIRFQLLLLMVSLLALVLITAKLHSCCRAS